MLQNMRQDHVLCGPVVGCVVWPKFPNETIELGINLSSILNRLMSAVHQACFHPVHEDRQSQRKFPYLQRGQDEFELVPKSSYIEKCMLRIVNHRECGFRNESSRKPGIHITAFQKIIGSPIMRMKNASAIQESGLFSATNQTNSQIQVFCIGSGKAISLEYVPPDQERDSAELRICTQYLGRHTGRTPLQDPITIQLQAAVVIPQ